MDKRKKWTIPSSAVSMVKAICEDYERRANALKNVDTPEEVASEYTRLNNAIECALLSVDVGIRKEFFRDVLYGRGFDMSPISPFLAKNTYYSRKRKFIYDVAKELHLI